MKKILLIPILLTFVPSGLKTPGIILIVYRFPIREVKNLMVDAILFNFELDYKFRQSKNKTKL